MNDKTLLLIILVLVAVCVIWMTNKKTDPFSDEDKRMGEKATALLEDMLEKGIMPPEITDEELEKLADDVLMVKTSHGSPDSSHGSPDSPSSHQRENLDFAPTQNTRYWPQYYYSFPYNYKYGGAWPPGMFSRLNFWSPGFYTGTGWSYYMRPGMGYKKWPRNVWLRNTTAGGSNYYYINNRDDTTHNAASYAGIPTVPR